MLENTENTEPENKSEAQEKKLNTEVEQKIEENNSDNSEVINEIENKLAESAENGELEEVAEKNYESFSLEELVQELRSLMDNYPIQSIHKNVNKIKSLFNVKFGELLKSEKQKFIEAGGESIDFKFDFPLKSTYNSILYDYKEKRNQYYKNQENELNHNLEVKRNLIESLKNLIDHAEGSTMYKKFQEIKEAWKNSGPIPRAKYNDTWRTFYHHTERFYDLLHLNNNLRDLDFKHNLEEKLKLVERAEDLAKMEDVSVAFKELQILHKMWKEDIGPVAKEFREEVWNKFSEASKTIHNKRHEFYKSLKSKFDENFEAKLKVIEKIKNYDASNNVNRNDWQKSIQDIEALRDEFFKIGRVSRAKNNVVWSKFKEATRNFNIQKNNFFKELKNSQLENLNKKKALIEQAVSLKDSEDWDMATEVFKKIQADWKKIGHVPRKYSDKLWKEFKDACNHYFDRFHDKQNEGNKEQLEVANKKKEYLNKLKKEIDEKTNLSLDELNSIMTEWHDLGVVPYEMRHIESKFNKLIDKIISQSEQLDKDEIELTKYKSLISSYVDSNNMHKLDSEQLFVRKKIDETVREIQQLENNIGFISNVKDDNPLIQNVKKDINSFKERLLLWKKKLEIIKSLTK